ncbi:MAG: hypothetical protein EP297_06705 [Gammaproteobacteria bacterium]|nr:MAG: hypothetical protein EP297_06705 [Gammaproteobacteria bacterium]
MNGVFNGCEKIEKEEIEETEALDCVHEMDTINHYVGMYPIASGGVIEKAFSPFLMSMLAVMLMGFMFNNPNIRMGVLSVGFTAIVIWMTMTWYVDDGLKYQNAQYLEGLVTSLDQDASQEQDLSPGAALIERLKASLQASGVEVDEEQKDVEATNEKDKNIHDLKINFELDQKRKPSSEQEQWNGNNAQMMSWHYGKSLGRYFNEPEKIKPMVSNMALASNIVFWLIIAAMLLLIFGTRKNGSLLYWLLIIPAILLPLFFIIDYSAWLWWYGHRMNEMGAFSVKPFMPTVFGDGKVAQFTTHSYPYIGFGYMVLSSVLLIIAANQRYKYFKFGG